MFFVIKAFFGMGIIGILLYIIVFGCLGAWLFPYAFNFWLEVAGKEPAIQAWQGFLVGLIPAVGQAIIPIAFITWLASFFIG